MRASGPAVHVHANTPVYRKIEPVLWALLARVCVRNLRWKKTLQVFDRLPAGRPATGGVHLPPERCFRGAGACLARSLARSQYLRHRGVESVIVIGATGTSAESFTLDAHAWLETIDQSPTHTAMHRVVR